MDMGHILGTSEVQQTRQCHHFVFLNVFSLGLTFVLFQVGQMCICKHG